MREETSLPKCTGWRGVHRFEARYDKSAAREVNGNIKSHSTADTIVVWEALRQVTYVRDVCTKCGVTIERQKL